MLAVTQKGYSLPIMESGIKVDGNVEVFPEEFCGVAFDMNIIDLSDELWEEVDSAIINEKIQYLKRFDGLYKNEKWCRLDHKRIEFDYISLSVEVKENKPVQYFIRAGFHDAVDNFMETDIEIPIDLRKYNGLVKNMFHRYIDDVFFKNC
ncbi:hypothetical protein [Enterocloster clostridioformis]|uniref:hypothetical protein n=1 Tax=Enterocloster clostridioformis TaxID=1531 RepID=UPI0022E1F5D3|nr:hypothetical protein [Enterocloster clostridioformis]